MLRIYLLAFACILGTPAPTAQPVTAPLSAGTQPAFLTAPDKVQAAALQLQNEMEKEGAEVLLGWMDRGTFVSRVNRGRSLGATFMAELRKTLNFEDLLGPTLDALQDGGSYRFLRTVENEGEVRARFRAVGADFDLNYHDVLFLRDAEGRTRIGDLYIISGGEDMSGLLGRIFESMSETNTHSGARRVYSFIDAYNNQRYREAWDGFPHEALTPDNRKPLLLIRMRVALEVGDEELAMAVADYAESFPDDPSLPINEIDHLFLAGRLPEALASIDRLEAYIGGDPYLDALRASVHLEGGQHHEARALSRQATEMDPDNVSAVLVELGVSEVTGDYVRLVDLLDVLEARFGYSFSPLDIEANPGNAGLILSEPYRLWRATR